MKKLIPLVFIGVFFVSCKDQDKESPEDKGNNNSSQVVEEGPDLSGIEYNLSGDSAFITKCTRVGQVIVPSVIENVAVTGIGDNAFFGRWTLILLPACSQRLLNFIGVFCLALKKWLAHQMIIK